MPATRPRRLPLILTVMAVAAWALSAPAVGAVREAGQPAAHPRISLSRSTGTATVGVRVSGAGFGRAEKVNIFFGAARRTVTRASRAGRFGRVTITVPVSARPGRHRIRATGRRTGRSAAGWFTVPADGGNWPQFHFQPSQDGYDSLENKLSPSDVHLLHVQWRFATGGIVNSSPAVASGVVYVGSSDGTFYALSAATGKKLWSHAGIGFTSSPAVADGVIYVGSTNKRVYALDAATGKMLWSHTTGSLVASSPAVADGVVYEGSYDDHLYAFSLK